MGMKVNNYPLDRVQEQIDEAEEEIRRLLTERDELERQLANARQQILNEEGIRRFCRLVSRNVDKLTKDQWQVLLGLLKLRVTVHSKELIAVRVALPPVKDVAEIELCPS